MNTPRTSVSKIETLLHKTEHFGMVSAPSAPRRCSLILLQRERCEDVSGEQLVSVVRFLPHHHRAGRGLHSSGKGAELSRERLDLSGLEPKT